MAYLGGYINVIYLLTLFTTLHYRDFNLDMSMLKRIYSQDSREQKSEPQFNNEKELLSHRVKSKKPFLMTFRHYCCSKLLIYTCCCCKQKKCMKRRKK